MKDKQAVIDSNVLVAITDSRDKWHEKAALLLNQLKTENIGLIYFDCVLNETISVMARRSEEQKRSAQFSELLDNMFRQIPVKDVTWISSKIEQIFSEVIELVRESSGILNFNDALIALFCRELNINAIISFNKDFDEISWLKRIYLPEDVKILSGL